jgi:hypothetical protein
MWAAEVPVPTDRQLVLLAAWLSAGNVKCAAESIEVREDSARRLMGSLYRRIGVANAMQAVAWCDDHVPGWRQAVLVA